MPARRDKRTDQWFYRKWVTNWQGVKERIYGTPPINTRAAAEAAERAHIKRVSEPPLPSAAVEREVQTLEDFVWKRWWPKYPPAARNAPTTLREKEMHLRLHLIPHLGHLPITEVKGEAIDGWLAALATETEDRDACSPKYIKNIRATLRKVLVKAQEWGDIVSVPAIPQVKVPVTEEDWFTAVESVQLFNACSEYDRLLIMFAIHTGARSGEQRVLEWGDLDFQAKTVTIQRSWAYSGSTTKAPKSGKPRTIPLTTELYDALKAFRGLRHLQGGLVFPDPHVSSLGGQRKYRALNTGEPRTYTSFQLHDKLKAACRRAGLREIRWQDLRHSFASQLASAGKALQLIQKWLGHSSIQMTMRYAKYMPSNEHTDINALCAPTERRSL